MGAARAGVTLGHAHIFTYYREALQGIAAEGLLAYLRHLSAPYVVGAVGQLNPAGKAIPSGCCAACSGVAHEVRTNQVGDSVARWIRQ